jgi:hypothetical protein
LALPVENLKKPFACFDTDIGEIIGNLVEILAGENVNDIATHG